MSENNNPSRREIIAGAGMQAIGAAIAKFGGLVSNADAKGKWPWPYDKLDPERAAETAYNA